jgi:hypothetical protein
MFVNNLTRKSSVAKGRGKGSQFERDLCRFFTEWISGSKEPLLFWRGRGSGGMMTRNFGVGKAFSGDLYAISDEGAWLTDFFSIEAKNGYASASFDKHLKYNKNDSLKDFWIQANRDAELVDKYPILIFRKKGLSPWVGVPKDIHMMFIERVASLRSITISWGEQNEDNLPDAVFFDFYEFFATVPAEDAKALKDLLQRGQEHPPLLEF